MQDDDKDKKDDVVPGVQPGADDAGAGVPPADGDSPTGDATPPVSPAEGEDKQPEDKPSE